MIYMPHKKAYHIFSSKAILYLEKCFSYALKHHKNDPVLIKASIRNIVPHCFGDHKKCDEKWCSAKFDTNCEHKSLLYGKKLCGEELKNI